MTGTDACKNIMREVNSVLSGKEDTVRKVLTAILAGGNILIEDIPGVGKTTMAKAFGEQKTSAYDGCNALGHYRFYHV